MQRWQRGRSGGLAWPALLLALACQIAFGALDLPDRQSDTAALQAASILCQSPASPGQAPPAHHRALTPALCPHAGAMAHAILLSTPFVPAPQLQRIGRADLPQARGPPARSIASAYPRGPPGLI